MKTFRNSILALSILLLIACGKEQQQSDIPVVDVTKTYPKKEIVLQDIADVEYIPLETRDDVLIDSYFHICTISPDSLLVGNYREGTVFLFNGQGKLVKKFNNKGASDKEYKEVWGIFYDKKTREIFIWDYPFKYQILVYDENGFYKRTLPINKDYSLRSNEIINYNENALLFHNGQLNFELNTKKDSLEKGIKPYVLLSKKDGKKLGNLPIAFSDRKQPNIVKKQKGGYSCTWAPLNSLTSDGEIIIYSDVSQDTIFSYSKDKKLTPIVVRKPKVSEMNKPFDFLQIHKMTSNYIFGEILGKRPKEKPSYPVTKICINRIDNKIYESKIINTDAPKAELNVKWFFENDNSLLLGRDRLAELLEEGKLKGKLKEIAENMNEDDNPVWVKIQFKK